MKPLLPSEPRPHEASRAAPSTDRLLNGQTQIQALLKTDAEISNAVCWNEQGEMP